MSGDDFDAFQQRLQEILSNRIEKHKSNSTKQRGSECPFKEHGGVAAVEPLVWLDQDLHNIYFFQSNESRRVQRNSLSVCNSQEEANARQDWVRKLYDAQVGFWAETKCAKLTDPRTKKLRLLISGFLQAKNDYLDLACKEIIGKLQAKVDQVLCKFKDGVSHSKAIYFFSSMSNPAGKKLTRYLNEEVDPARLAAAWKATYAATERYTKLLFSELERGRDGVALLRVKLDPRDFLVYHRDNQAKTEVRWRGADRWDDETNVPVNKLSRRWLDTLLSRPASPSPRSLLCLGMFVTLVASSHKLVPHGSFDAALGVLGQELDSASKKTGLNTTELLSNSIGLVANLRSQRQGHFRTFLSALANSTGLKVPLRGVHQNPRGEAADNKPGDPGSMIFTQMHDWKAPPTLAVEQYIDLLKRLLTCKRCDKHPRTSLEEALESVDNLAKGHLVPLETTGASTSLQLLCTHLAKAEHKQYLQRGVVCWGRSDNDKGAARSCIVAFGFPHTDGFVPNDNDDWPQAMYENGIGVCASYTTDSISNFSSAVVGGLQKGSEDYKLLQGFFQSSKRSSDKKAKLLCYTQPDDNGFLSDYLSHGKWEYAAEVWPALFSLMGRYSALLLQRAVAGGTDDKPLWLFDGWDPAHVAVYFQRRPALVSAEKKHILSVEVRLLDNLPVFCQQGYSFLIGDLKRSFLQKFENKQEFLQALLYLALLTNGAEHINTSTKQSQALEPLLNWLPTSTSTEKGDYELLSSAHELATEFSLASKHGLERLLLLKTKPRSSLFGRGKDTEKEQLQKRLAKLWFCRKCHKKKPSRP